MSATSRGYGVGIDTHSRFIEVCILYASERDSRFWVCGPHSDDVRGLLRASCTTRSVSPAYARICEGFMAGRTTAPKWDTRRHKDG